MSEPKTRPVRSATSAYLFPPSRQHQRPQETTQGGPATLKE